MSVVDLIYGNYRRVKNTLNGDSSSARDVGKRNVCRNNSQRTTNNCAPMFSSPSGRLQQALPSRWHCSLFFPQRYYPAARQKKRSAICAPLSPSSCFSVRDHHHRNRRLRRGNRRLQSRHRGTRPHQSLHEPLLPRSGKRHAPPRLPCRRHGSRRCWLRSAVQVPRRGRLPH